MQPKTRASILILKVMFSFCWEYERKNSNTTRDYRRIGTRARTMNYSMLIVLSATISIECTWTIFSLTIYNFGNLLLPAPALVRTFPTTRPFHFFLEWRRENTRSKNVRWLPLESFCFEPGWIFFNAANVLLISTGAWTHVRTWFGMWA